MLLIAIMALGAAAPAAPTWREYDLRLHGEGETLAYYDAGHVERRGGRVRVWTRYEFLRNDRPSLRISARVEIDCARRRSRTLVTTESLMPLSMESDDGLWTVHTPRPTVRRLRQRPAPIVPGSADAALARLVCGGDAAGP